MLRKLIPMVAISAVIIALCVPWFYASGADPTWTQTTVTDFNAGTLSDVQVVDIGGGDGDVQLDLQDWGSWSSNLLTNPGAETGDTTGWTATGSNPGSFSASSDCTSGSAGPHGGSSNCFFWDPSSATDDWAYQDVDLTGYTGYIGAGLAQVYAQGWLVSSEYQASPPLDRTGIKVEVYTAGDVLIATPWLTNLWNLSSWSYTGATWTLQTNTGYARFMFQACDSGGSDAGNVDDLSFAIRTRSYYSSGTLTSSIHDAGVAYTFWDTMSWSETLNGQTIDMKVRTSNDAGMAGATDWASAPTVTNGQDISGLSSVTDGHRYIQYRAELSTSDTLQTPVLHDVSISYTTNDPPDAPSNLGPTAYVDGSWSTDNTPTLTFTQNDPNADDVQYTIQIDDSAGFGSPVVDYTSGLLGHPGAGSFTVGQAAGGGSYNVNSATLPDGYYYWRVMSTDQYADASGWSVANGGAVAFRTDASTEGGGSIDDTYHPNDDVEVSASGFLADSYVDVYVVNDGTWSDGDPIPADVGDGMDTIQADGSGDIGPVVVWYAQLDIGEYDVVFDADQNGYYDEIPDLVEDPNHPGFVVVSATVGGEVYPIDKATLLLHWLGLGAILVLATGCLIMVRRRSHK